MYFQYKTVKKINFRLRNEHHTSTLNLKKKIINGLNEWYQWRDKVYILQFNQWIWWIVQKMQGNSLVQMKLYNPTWICQKRVGATNFTNSTLTNSGKGNWWREVVIFAPLKLYLSLLPHL